MEQYQIKWNSCLIYQDNKEAQEVNPAVVGCGKLVTVLQQWKNGGIVPRKLDKERVDEVVTLSVSEPQENGAFWHKLCRNKCDNHNLKRKLESESQKCICMRYHLYIFKTHKTKDVCEKEKWLFFLWWRRREYALICNKITWCESMLTCIFDWRWKMTH